jgi:dihydrofolate reductase
VRRLVVGTYITVDGVMQAPGGPDEDRDGGFVHGGWSFPFWDDNMGRLVEDWTERASGLVIGRKTYDIFAAHWPRVTSNDPIAAKLNRMPKYVASRTLANPTWQNTTVLQGDIASAVKRLKEDSGPELQVIGSGNLVQTLMKHHLVDEYRVWIFPVVLGSGKRLFAEGTVPSGLTLLDTRTSGSGVTIQRYERTGKPKYGSFALDVQG